MSWEPSGDQAGALLVPRKRGKAISLPRSMEYMQIWALTTPVEWLVAGEGDAGSVRRPAGHERDGAEAGELVLIGAIVVHDPDFLEARAGTDEGDVGGGDAGQARRRSLLMISSAN